MKKSMLFFVLIVLFVGYFEAKTQPPPYVDEAIYKNYSPEEIPAVETIRAYDILGSFMYDDYIIKTFPTYCNNVFENQQYCPGGQWGNWQNGVYNLRHAVTDCEIRVEYRWRRCLSDWNIRQQQIISLFFETSDWPLNTDCDDLQDWLNGGDPVKLHWLFEDMYQKIALEAFKSDNEAFKSITGYPIYCNTINHPTKVHHVNGSCKSYCICTSNYGGKISTWISMRNCADDFCCIITDEYCIDSTTQKIRFQSHANYSTPGIQDSCATISLPDHLCPGETCAITPCIFACGDNYCVQDYDHYWWLDYPFRDTYRDELDDMYFGIAPAPPKQHHTDVPELKNQNLVSIIPHPVRNSMELRFNESVKEIQNIKIYDIKGNTMMSIDYNQGDDKISKIETSSLSNGTYYIAIKYKTDYIIKKFIIMK